MGTAHQEMMDTGLPEAVREIAARGRKMRSCHHTRAERKEGQNEHKEEHGYERKQQPAGPEQ